MASTIGHPRSARDQEMSVKAMNKDWYTIVWEPNRLLAVKVDSTSAAEAWLAGREVVLAEHVGLARMAALDHRNLVVRTRPLSHIHRYFPPLKETTIVAMEWAT
jgi:hypothetical protein